MIIAAEYSFNNGEKYIKKNYSHLLKEIENVIKNVDAKKCKTKISQERTMMNKILYSPKELNKEFKEHFYKKNWVSKKETCNYSNAYYTESYKETMFKTNATPAYREMDFLKEKLGVEVQFGKYAFMVYNVCAKMTIFKNLGHIDAGVEIVPVRQFSMEMSTGVSFFEQFSWDLEKRGASNIDIPVFVLGVDDHR